MKKVKYNIKKDFEDFEGIENLIDEYQYNGLIKEEDGDEEEGN